MVGKGVVRLRCVAGRWSFFQFTLYQFIIDLWRKVYVSCHLPELRFSSSIGLAEFTVTRALVAA